MEFTALQKAEVSKSGNIKSKRSDGQARDVDLDLTAAEQSGRVLQEAEAPSDVVFHLSQHAQLAGGEQSGQSGGAGRVRLSDHEAVGDARLEHAHIAAEARHLLLRQALRHQSAGHTDTVKFNKLKQAQVRLGHPAVPAALSLRKSSSRSENTS